MPGQTQSIFCCQCYKAQLPELRQQVPALSPQHTRAARRSSSPASWRMAHASRPRSTSSSRAPTSSSSSSSSASPSRTPTSRTGPTSGTLATRACLARPPSCSLRIMVRPCPLPGASLSYLFFHGRNNAVLLAHMGFLPAQGIMPPATWQRRCEPTFRQWPSQGQSCCMPRCEELCSCIRDLLCLTCGCAGAEPQEGPAHRHHRVADAGHHAGAASFMQRSTHSCVSHILSSPACREERAG